MMFSNFPPFFKKLCSKNLSFLGDDDDEDNEDEEEEDEEERGSEAESCEKEPARPTCLDYFMHFLSVPWKLLFATIPPTGPVPKLSVFVPNNERFFKKL